MRLNKKWKDLASRAAWTALQAALGVLTVEVFNLPTELAPIVAVALSALKSYVATKVGNPDTVTFDDEDIVPGEVPAELLED